MTYHVEPPEPEPPITWEAIRQAAEQPVARPPLPVALITLDDGQVHLLVTDQDPVRVAIRAAGALGDRP